MKESITKFDLEAAFKALDEIDIPKVKGLRPNKMDLSEATNRVDRTSMLVEDYYNLNSQEDLQEASEDREAEVAKAKLARIEKIVDLNADTEDAILPSYVGKLIIQCPQCMTLFYKDEADVTKSEEDPTNVNVGEVCQHCGNDTGYTLIGKVAEETPEELSNETAEEETAETEELPELEGEEATEENTENETNSEEENTEELPDLEELPLPDEEETKEEKEKNESLNNSKLLKDIRKKSGLASKNTSKNLTLNEDLDTVIPNLLAKANVVGVDYEEYDSHGVIGDIYISFNDKASLEKAIDDVYKLINTLPANFEYQIWNPSYFAEDKILTPDDWYKEIIHYYITDPTYPDTVEELTDEDIKQLVKAVDIGTDDIWVNFSIYEREIGESLKEDLDTDMSKYNAYIDYIQSQIKADEEELKKAGDNQLIKDAIQKKLDAHKADLEGALPPVVKDIKAEEELPTPEEAKVDEAEEKVEEDSKKKNESLNNSKLLKDIKKKNELASENSSENTTLNEDVNSNFETILDKSAKHKSNILINSPLTNNGTVIIRIENWAKQNDFYCYLIRGRNTKKLELALSNGTIDKELNSNTVFIIDEFDKCSSEIRKELLTKINEKKCLFAVVIGDKSCLNDAQKARFLYHLDNNLNLNDAEKARFPLKVDRNESLNETVSSFDARKAKADQLLDNICSNLEDDYDDDILQLIDNGLIHKRLYYLPGFTIKDEQYIEDKVNEYNFNKEIAPGKFYFKSYFINNEDDDEPLEIGYKLKAKKDEYFQESIIKEGYKVDREVERIANTDINSYTSNEDKARCELYKLTVQKAKTGEPVKQSEIDKIAKKYGIKFWDAALARVPMIRKEECDSKVCEKCGKEICECDKALTEDEDISLTFSDEAIEDMFNSKEFKTPISDAEVEGYLADDKAVESLNKVDDIQESSFNKHISDYLTEVYSNVDNFEMTNCQLDYNKLVVEGVINFKSGNTKETSFTFRPRANKILEGYNKDIAESANAFKVSYSNKNVKGCGNTLITESVEYNYSADNTVVKGRK